LTGVEVPVGEIWKTKFTAPALQAIGLKLPLTPKTKKPQVNAEIFDNIDHPVVHALGEARKVNKLRTTFAASVKRHAIKGRIHCTLNQTRRERSYGDGTVGAAYGRLSCQNPNLQQQPSKDKFAKMWRAIYLPEEGHLWASNDFSQQEPKMVVHYATMCEATLSERAFKIALQARDNYRNNPDQDGHQMVADMIGMDRTPAKTIYLGYSYGMGGALFCKRVGLPTRQVVRDKKWRCYDPKSPEGKLLLQAGAKLSEVPGKEGQALLDQFNEKLPFVKELAKSCERKAKRVGYLTTLGGRRCRFPKDKYGRYDWTHKSLNRLIQGGSADQTKQSIIDCDEAGFDIMLQIHDEIAFNVKRREEAEAAAELMRNAIALTVPTKVDVEVGESWGHSMGWDGRTPE